MASPVIDGRNAIRILIVADDPLSRTGLATLLQDQPGCVIAGQIPGTADVLAAVLESRPDVVAWDFGWNAEATLEHLGDLKEVPLAVVPGPVGHYGGTLTHGEGFLLEPLAALPPADASEFVRTIQPIFKRCCTKCHNPHKHKGELDLTTIEGIKKGGESDEVIEAGKPDESQMIVLLSLPEDDDDVMPPSGKQPRPTAAEIETLRAWIAAGAKFE